MKRLVRIRESFWFVPASMTLGAIVLAQLMVALDFALERSNGAYFPDLLSLGVDGSRGLLAAIGGSMLAVAGTTFSITISVIATASSSYGPRLVRNFMADRRNQAVLGLFVSTFVYALLVLRSITQADEDIGRATFVPFFAVYMGIVLALANVAALIYFLHHTAESIQVAFLVRRVRCELEDVAQELYGAERCQERRHVTALEGHSHPVRATEAGFVVRVNHSALISLAAKHHGVIELVASPGHHVIAGEVLANVWNIEEDVDGPVRHAFFLGDTRTPAQDMNFAVQQMIEMAVRALSTGSNDPYTARNVLDEIAAGVLVALRNPEPPPGRLDGSGVLRLVWRPPTAQDILDRIFDDIRIHGASDPTVMRRAVLLANRALGVIPPSVEEYLTRHVHELFAAMDSAGLSAFDRDRVVAAWQGDPG